jgi:hypothetical protein
MGNGPAGLNYRRCATFVAEAPAPKHFLHHESLQQVPPAAGRVRALGARTRFAPSTQVGDTGFGPVTSSVSGSPGTLLQGSRPRRWLVGQERGSARPATVVVTLLVTLVALLSHRRRGRAGDARERAQARPDRRLQRDGRVYLEPADATPAWAATP